MFQSLQRIAAITMLVLAMVAPVKADPPRPLRELALAIAKVAMNEYRDETEDGQWNGTVPSELLLIVQVTESHGRSPRARLRWLRRHSRRVLGDDPNRPCREGRNCQWTRNLTWSNEEPEGWPTGSRWNADAWEKAKELSWRAVTGEDTRRPCRGRPMTWGSRRLDYNDAVAEGQIPVHCETPDDGNVGFEWRRSSLTGVGIGPG
jgi:hypothetical protein